MSGELLDVFSSLDGFDAASANWSGYWGKQGPELLDHRLASYSTEQRMVFGANTLRAFTEMLAASTEESDVPLRSHGSLSMNRALMGAGLVDRVQVTLFPVITGRPGWTRSSRARPTSTWSCSSTARSTGASRSSSTGRRRIDPSRTPAQRAGPR